VEPEALPRVALVVGQRPPVARAPRVGPKQDDAQRGEELQVGGALPRQRLGGERDLALAQRPEAPPAGELVAQPELVDQPAQARADAPARQGRGQDLAPQQGRARRAQPRHERPRIGLSPRPLHHSIPTAACPAAVPAAPPGRALSRGRGAPPRPPYTGWGAPW